jgi:hypothetical protein
MDAEATARVGDALDLLRAEHEAIRRHFDDFELTLEHPVDHVLKAAIAGRIGVACRLHFQLEEELLYPAARSVLHADALVEHALCDHAGSRELIARLDASQPQDADFDATVAVLAAYVVPHMEEEERELFPRLRHSPLDLVPLGRRMVVRQKVLHDDAFDRRPTPERGPPTCTLQTASGNQDRPGCGATVSQRTGPSGRFVHSRRP